MLGVTRLEAPAKLTLALQVAGVRDDGYHLIVAEMASLDLCDVVDITEVADRKVAALAAHDSQVGHMADFPERVFQAMTMIAERGGLPAGRYAEAFMVVNTA